MVFWLGAGWSNISWLVLYLQSPLVLKIFWEPAFTRFIFSIQIPLSRALSSRSRSRTIQSSISQPPRWNCARSRSHLSASLLLSNKLRLQMLNVILSRSTVLRFVIFKKNCRTSANTRVKVVPSKYQTRMEDEIVWFHCAVLYRRAFDTGKTGRTTGQQSYHLGEIDSKSPVISPVSKLQTSENQQLTGAFKYIGSLALRELYH